MAKHRLDGRIKGMDLSPTDMIAGLALLVACVAAWTTWRIHKDSGGRVQVQMNAAAYFPYAGTGRLERSEKGKFFLNESPEPSVELAQIIIENPGRTGVTVTGVGLRIEGLNRANHSIITPRSFLLEGYGGSDARPEDYFRLEPYDRRTLLFDYWSILDAEFDKDPSLRELTIHAEVTVAGHSNPFDSKHHGYWRIQRDFVSAVGGHTIRRPRNIILAEFLRSNSRELAAINYMDQYAVTVEDTADPNWNYTKFEEHLKQLLEDPSSDLVHLTDPPLLHHSAVLQIFNQLQRLGPKAKPFPVLDHRKHYYKARRLTPRTETNASK
ncbi:hypothetical protein OVA06_19435 [Pseudarthrobacter sp. SL88]|uniref:hypothetical protein n=1 Tax=Pseudarthrobacter sp. SL88 TaxID=2994666 RepID=UPI0022730F30|nr:hypothetical protein [Pseudarthrobacter sp. SL88]MCY1676846.1 hypothetical protein [Pseudarthrobacter sp. SL88]